MSGIRFELAAADGLARLGRLFTAHGVIDTPAFMPVGTAATVKAMTPDAVALTGAQVVLCNTYHLMLRPGAEAISNLGGLHKFMNWPGPILTDSGGFQVMSLSKLCKMSEKGVVFQSHLDGSRQELTPERAIEIQRLLCADISMVLDECTPFPATEEQAEKSMELSMRWALRSKQAFQERQEGHGQEGHGLFGIVQGGVFDELRRRSAAALCDIGFDGYAIGGLAVGEGQATMLKVLAATTLVLPSGKPRYLMGVGKPDDLVSAVALGVDMFDCVIPTRSGRTSQAFTRQGALNLRNAKHAADPNPMDDRCSCPACAGYSRAYLHHLVKAGEILGAMLLTWHNLHYYQDLMKDMRAAIKAGVFSAFAAGFAKRPSIDDSEG